ncbi:MAG: chorismate synthase [Oscillospiraceae bacterium]|nr:chorismate synthase [Oscillospiraceae bacterium]
MPKLTLTIFGESHGPIIGCVLAGLPAGIPVDGAAIALQMARRAPGDAAYATVRREADQPEILSGVYNGYTAGTPVAMIIRNTNTRPADYDAVAASNGDVTGDSSVAAGGGVVPRPNHADYPAAVKYGGYADMRGGGHFSGRLTAPLVFAGALCRGFLAQKGIRVAGHVSRIGDIRDSRLDPVDPGNALLERLSEAAFPVIDGVAKARMLEQLAKARADGDSIGGAVEVIATGLPVGLGSPLFDGAEGVLSRWLFGIPAVKAVAFGAGAAFAGMTGSQANDPFVMRGGDIRTATNHCGGILGGMTSGMPLTAEVTFKPTPSIAKEQQSVDLHTGQAATLAIKGRHDPCVVPRAVPCVEAAVMLGVAQLIVES